MGQVGKRRVAGAEVVEGEADTERAERPQRLLDGLGLTEHRRLGDLEAQAGRVEAGGLKGRLDGVGQAGLGELDG